MALTYQTIRGHDLGGGIDARSSENLIQEGYSEDLLNADTLERRILKRVGYQGHSGYLPLRATSVEYNTDSTDNITFKLDNSIDLGEVRSTPIVVYGRTSESGNPSELGRFGYSDSVQYYPEWISDPRKVLTAPSGTLSIDSSDHGFSTDNLFIGTVESTSSVNLSHRTFIPDSLEIDQLSFDVDLGYTVATDKNILVYYADKSAVTGETYITPGVTTGGSFEFVPGDVADDGSGNLEITEASHGFSDGDIITFSTNTTLPTGLTAGTTYYVVSSTASTLQVSTTLAGSPVAFTDGGTGIHLATSTILIGGTITAATHLLNNFNVIVKVYESVGGRSKLVVPDSVTITPTGTVEITVTNSSAAPVDYFAILSSAPDTNLATGAVLDGATETIVISGVSGKFPFLGVYLEPTIGGTVEEVVPDSVVYDATANTITVTFTNDTGSTKNFEIYYEFGTLITNEITVTDSSTIGTAYTDNRPQLTIWGLCHEDIYSSNTTSVSTNRAGWVTHIDSYRRSAEERLIAGLGGNIFASRLNSEVSSSYLLPTLYARLRERASVDTVISPLFHETGDTPGRARGYITTSDGGSNFLEVESISYDSGDGWVDYVINTPGRGYFDSSDAALSDSQASLDAVVSTTANLEDYLQIQDAGYAVHNGTFKVRAVDNTSATQVTISVENTSVTSSDFDEVDVGGLAGVFTDQVPLTATSPFVSGDVIDSGLFDASDVYTTTSSSGSVVVIDGVTDTVEIPGGLRLGGTRTSDVIPLRTVVGTATSTNMLQGDMLTYTPIDRQLRVRSVNPNADLTCTITGDGTTATVTLTSGDTTAFGAGRKILLTDSGVYSGTQTVASVVDATTMTFASTSTAAGVSGTILGETIHIDESLEWSDDLENGETFSVHSRWIPIEAPDDNYDLTPSTYVHHFDAGDYTQQNFLRSTMANNNLYFTNGDDEVMKFDGANVYRAGLFRWSPQLFAATDTGATGLIDIDAPFATVTATQINQFEVTRGHETRFSVGDIVRYDDGVSYRITKLDDNGTVGLVNVAPSTLGTSPATGTLTRRTVYRYYFRLNAVDANDNIIASAATGSQDFRVELGADAAVYIKLVGMPAWGNYDYDRLEVQIYRTLANPAETGIPFYRLTTIPMEFDNGAGYIEYTDTNSDDTLVDLDPVNTILLVQEIGTTWTEPMRAKYVTSSNGRLILANLTDYPQLDIQVTDSKSTGPVTLSDFTAAGSSKWAFRRDSTETGTTTDMTNYINYEFVDDSSAVTLTPASDISASAGVSFTVASPGHSLVVGDWVYLYHDAVADGNDLEFAGWWQINSVSAGVSFTILSDTARAGAAADVDRYVTSSTSKDVPVLLGEDGNRGTIEGNSSLSARKQAMTRLGEAINTTMRVTDVSIPGQETFTPWMIAGSGGDFGAGQLVVRQPRVESVDAELILDSLLSTVNVFVNSLRRSAGDDVTFVERIYPSRIIESYPNFPELFDAPAAITEDNSDSVKDINTSDGQELTGVIPFFGEATTGDSQKEGIITAFKQNSIYVFNTETRQDNRLESQGLGCTAPYSIVTSRGGVNFANDSGIYQVDRSFRVRYLGKRMERNWQESVNRDRLDIMQGHNYSLGRQYKLSVPVSADQSNSEVYVYDHTREAEQGREGAWSRYDSHKATGWANLATDAYFGSTEGRVFSIRRVGDATDYRDDDTAISWNVKLRANDLGNAGIRKAIASIISHLRAGIATSGTTLAVSLDLSESFEDTETLVVERDDTLDNLSDFNNRSVVTIRSSMAKRKCVYIQLRYTNSTIDEPVELAGVDIKAAPLSRKGIQEAADV